MVETSIVLASVKLAPVFFKSIPVIYNFLSDKNKKIITQNEFTTIVEAYYNKIYSKYYYANTILAPNSRIKLEDIYQPLTIRMSNMSISSSRFIIDKYPEKLFAKHKRILIKDNAGMGKSTLLRRIFLESIDHIDESKDPNIKIPILIDLRKLSSINNFMDLITFEIFGATEKYREIFFDLVQSGKFIFLLDGFDEVPSNKYETSINQIREFSETYFQNIFILTSRDEPILTSLSSFAGFNIVGLLRQESIALIKKYCGCLNFEHVHLVKELDDDGNRHLFELLKNPLMVTLLVIAYDHKKKIPLKKIDYYEQVYDALYEKHDISKNTPFDRLKKSGLGKFSFSTVLRNMAILSLTRYSGKIEFTATELHDLISSSKALMAGNFDADDFLNDVIHSVPIFVKDGACFRWVHKSFQDFYAASWLYQSKHEKLHEIKELVFNDLEKNFNLMVFYYELDELEVSRKILKPFLTELIAHGHQELPEPLANAFSSGVIEHEKITSFFGAFFIEKVETEIEDNTLKSLITAKLSSALVASSLYLVNPDLVVQGVLNHKRIRRLDFCRSCKINIFKNDSKGVDRTFPDLIGGTQEMTFDYYKNLTPAQIDEALNLKYELLNCYGKKIDIHLTIDWSRDVEEKISQQSVVKLI